MPARKSVTWGELRVGLFVLLALAIVGTFVFYVTGEGVLFAHHSYYKTYLPDVAGLKAGSPVRLAGVEVGTVEHVGLSQYRQDPTRNTVVRFRVQERYRDDIRTDSEAFITTEGLLGESVLEVKRGHTGERIPSGGIVPGTQRGNIKQIVENVNAITGDVRTLIADLRGGKGTLGRLIVDPGLYTRANNAVTDFQSLTQRAAAGEGTLGKLMVSDELYNQLKGTADTLDQAASDIRAGKGTLGQLIYNSEFYDQAVSVVKRADKIVGRVEDGQGTLGKLINDDTLHNDIQQTFANTRDITRKLNEGEGTFGRAVNDPRLYENVNKFTAEMRALLEDFRKNPKKYLHVKLSLF